jgi:hypothetical protein
MLLFTPPGIDSHARAKSSALVVGSGARVTTESLCGEGSGIRVIDGTSGGRYGVSSAATT